jgi:hypothetical protein
LSPVNLRIWIPSAYLRRWLSGTLTITFLRCLHIVLGANTGIVSQFSTVETTIWVNWSIIPYWCTWAILIKIWSTWCHSVELFELIKRMIRLLILSMISALYTRTKLRALWQVVTRSSVTARLPWDWNLRFCSRSSSRLFSRPITLSSNIWKLENVWLCNDS